MTGQRHRCRASLAVFSLKITVMEIRYDQSTQKIKIFQPTSPCPHHCYHPPPLGATLKFRGQWHWMTYGKTKAQGGIQQNWPRRQDALISTKGRGREGAWTAVSPWITQCVKASTLEEARVTQERQAGSFSVGIKCNRKNWERLAQG